MDQTVRESCVGHLKPINDTQLDGDVSLISPCGRESGNRKIVNENLAGATNAEACGYSGLWLL